MAQGYRAKALEHRINSAFFHASQREKTDPNPSQSAAEVEPAIAYFDRIANHYKMLIDKDHRVASRPWAPVESDPPEPE